MSKVSLNGAKPGRGGTLDALRFAAALFIVLFHYGDNAPVPLVELHPAFGYGHLATDFFLLLSGYVLGRAYGRAIEAHSTPPFEFLTRRVVRIWPAHAIVLSGMVVLVTMAAAVGIDIGSGGNFVWSDLAPQFFLVQAWADVGGWGWNTPSWSLSALIVCYALFPFLWMALARISHVAAAAGVGAVTLLLDVTLRGVIGHSLFDLTFNMGVVRALPFFVGGMVLARWAIQAPLPGRIAGPGAILAGLALIALQFTGRHDAASLALIGMIVLCIGSVEVARPSRTIEAAGKLSFSLFITHILAATVWFGGLNRVDTSSWPPAVLWTAWGGGAVFALVFAFMFDRFIDQPVQKWVSPRVFGLFGKSRPASGKAAAERT